MCGRTRCTLRVDDVPRACHVNNRPLRTLNTDRYRPMYNVSPGAYMPVVRRDDGCNSEGVAVHCMKWGLVPSFTKKSDKPDHFKMFNARSESIREKASFRRLIPKNRCLVAVEGFYEWKKDGSKKQPYYIHFKDGRPLVFAALYDSWENSEGETLYTFTIVTTSSSSSLQWLHDRMPVILGDEGAIELWLNGASSSKFETILKPYEESDLGWYPVTPAMGKTSFNGPECIKEIELKMEQKNQISKFFAKKEKMGNQKLGTEKEGSSDESFKGNMVTSLKEESANTDVSPLPSVLKERPEIKDVHQLPSAVKKEEKEEVCAPDISGREVAKCQVKREYDEFSADSKSTNIIDKASPTPKKKKGNVRNADDKQPTLLSYFGKS